MEHRRLTKPLREIEQVIRTEGVRVNRVVEPLIKADQGSEIDDQVHFPLELLGGVGG